jgi:hypothetical protein
MRKVTFGGANSLDNYLAGPDHALDWLLWGDEAAAVMADYWKTIDERVHFGWSAEGKRGPLGQL